MREPNQSLDTLSLPLQGSRLIEASAGTGKTWTIAALVLRLVVGHGCTPRMPGEILVMTFTKAATRELASRIRDRLAEAAAAMRGDNPGAAPSADAFMLGLRDAFPPGPARDQAAWRLAMAAQAMDEAGVFTIDAWCQRMLREHAFDSGSLFDETLQPDEAALRAEAVRDVWRQQVYPLPEALLGQVLQRWKDLEALDKDMLGLLDKPLPAGAGAGTLAQRMTEALHQRSQTLRDLKAGWVQRAGQMQDWLRELRDGPQRHVGKAVPTQANAGRWLQALKDWADDPALEKPDVKAGAERLGATDLRRRLDAAGATEVTVPEPFEAFESLLAQLARLPDPQAAMRLHLAGAVHTRLQALKARAGTFGFADALQRLDEALDEARHGERAQRLRERILARYPVAMVDEFQDTSPVQLRIFDRLYRIADNDPARTLLLIGDPKQAIYGFRGADIHSYLQARRATAGRHHALATNHRSTVALVHAVNRLFEGAEHRGDEGAFLFGHPGAASPLPFVAVQARGRPERLVGAEGAMRPITMVADASRRDEQAGSLPSKADSLRLLAALCVERIVTLLNDPAVGFEPESAAQDGAAAGAAAGPAEDPCDDPCDGPGGHRMATAQARSSPRAGFRRLRPGDIAVLVHARHQADAVRTAMQRRGLASVYLSDRDSVFASDEAADLLRLMRAVEQPRDVRLARSALATALLGLPVPDLLAMAADDTLLDRQCERLRQLGEAWRGRGILAMVRQALHTFGLPARWLAGDAIASRGERRLTNVLHLAELLQAATLQARTPAALIAWLHRQIEDADHAPDGGEQVLRLESDADRVQVVTIHKSKGLEYPLVFVPFAAHVRELGRNAGEARDLALLVPDEGDVPDDLLDDLPDLVANDATSDSTNDAQDDAPDDAADNPPDFAEVDQAGPTPAPMTRSPRRVLVLSPSPEQIEAARLDQRREQLRLFYVAATRARHALWLGLSEHSRTKGQPSTWSVSPPGHLLASGLADGHPPAEQEPAATSAMLRDLVAYAAADQDIDLHIVQGTGDIPWPAVTPLAPRDPPAPLDAAPSYHARFERHWAVSSYSQLMRGLGNTDPASPSAAGLEEPTRSPAAPQPGDTHGGTVPARKVREDEPAEPGGFQSWATAPNTAVAATGSTGSAGSEGSMGVTDTSGASGPSELPSAAQAPADPVDAPWHRFPRGAFAGDFLHDQLEWLAGERFLLDSSADLQQRLMRRCKRLGWEARADDVVAWLRQVCSRPLPALGAPLAGLATVAPEMEFWYPIECLSLPALDACCRRHILPGQPRPALSPRTVQGMMMGYADLVFEHGGRYWVLDHKSNSLGRADADYDLETLKAAILAHRYDVQAALYLLALHRLLRARLHDGYKPAQHLGGAIYLFLRGVAAAQAGCSTLPATHELLADLDRLLPASPPSAAGPREDGA